MPNQLISDPITKHNYVQDKARRSGLSQGYPSRLHGVTRICSSLSVTLNSQLKRSFSLSQSCCVICSGTVVRRDLLGVFRQGGHICSLDSSYTQDQIRVSLVPVSRCARGREERFVRKAYCERIHDSLTNTIMVFC